MAVTTLTTQIKEPPKYPVLPVVANSLDFAFTAPAVAADGIDFTSTGREVVLIQNTTVGAATFTVVSAADEKNRTGDITAYSLAAGEFAAIIPPSSGWAVGGKIKITMSDVGVLVAVLRMPSTL